MERPTLLVWRTVQDAIGDLPDPEHEAARAAAVTNHRFQPGARAYPGHTGSPLDEPAKTLKASVHGVPRGENMFFRPDGSLRYLTARVRALANFSRRFRFSRLLEQDHAATRQRRANGTRRRRARRPREIAGHRCD